MADFYFNNAVNTSLSELGNYWLDFGFTIPAVGFPGDADNVTASSANIASGTASSLASWQIGGSCTVSGGTFNGPVSVTTVGFIQITGGTYNNDVTIQGPIIVSGGTYNADFIVGGSFSDYSLNGSVDFNGRISFDNSATFLYHPSADGVADPSDVRDGVFNLGVEGTLGGGTITITVT